MKKVNLSIEDLFKSLDIKDESEARKVFEAAFNFLLYIEVGESIELPSCTIKKISHDKLAISQSISNQCNLVRLKKGHVIKVDI